MIYRIFLIIILLSASVQAFQYEFHKPSNFPALDIYEVTRKLASHGFYELDLKRKGHVFSTSIDQIYLHSSSEIKQAILVLGLQPKNKEKTYKISDTEFVCHAETDRGQFFSLYLKVENKNEFDSICNSFSTKSKFTWLRQPSFLSLFMNRANAECSNCDKLLTLDPNLIQLGSTMENMTFLQKLGTCVSDAISGSGQVFSGAVDGFLSLLSNPQKLWSELSQQATAMRDFITELKDEVIQLKKTWNDVDSEILLSLACHLGGEVLTASSVALVSGVGVLKLSTTLAQAFLKLKNMHTLLKRVSQIKINGNPKVAKEILSCAVSD